MLRCIVPTKVFAPVGLQCMTAVPSLPDDILRYIHHLFALETALRTTVNFCVQQYESASSRKRNIADARGWTLGKFHMALLRGTVRVQTIPTPAWYNFTLLQHPTGIGVLESNAGEGIGTMPLTLQTFIGILPWGSLGTHTLTHAGWSRATRSARVQLPVWYVPRAWGFDGPKGSVSKVIVREPHDSLPPVEEGIVDPNSDSRGIVRLNSVPDEARCVRCM